MKIGVVSDTHGRLEMTQSAVRLLCERGAELILHCGDIDSPSTVRLFTEIPTHFVLGNWDLRPRALKPAIEGRLRELGEYCILVRAGLSWPASDWHGFMAISAATAFGSRHQANSTFCSTATRTRPKFTAPVGLW
jgi:hypothetical protein